jgi:hypothetical protein
MILKDIREVDDFQRITLSEFSYSRIDTYEMCPSKYFYSYIKREPRMFSAPAVLREYCSWRFRGSCLIY